MPRNELAPLKCEDAHCDICAAYADAAEQTAAILRAQGDERQAFTWDLTADAYREGLIDA